MVVLFSGHLLSTSTFDLLVWTAITWLVVRAVRTGDDRLWLVAGVVLGIGLLNKPLPAFLALGMLAGVAISGPRRLLRNPSVWAGAAIALVLWSPWLIWQADHGWPQIDVSREIAGGGSTSSEAWWAIVPFQFLLISPFLAPVWIAGLVRLFRDPAVRDFASWPGPGWCSPASSWQPAASRITWPGCFPLCSAPARYGSTAGSSAAGRSAPGGARRGDRAERGGGPDHLAADPPARTPIQSSR